MPPLRHCLHSIFQDKIYCLSINDNAVLRKGAPIWINGIRSITTKYYVVDFKKLRDIYMKQYRETK